MITANQARANYQNKLVEQRDHFITNVIEPAILEASKTAHIIKIKAVSSYSAKTSIHFSSYSKEDYEQQYDGYNVKLTDAILDKLKDHGYKIREAVDLGRENYNGYGYFIVSWSE